MSTKKFIYPHNLRATANLWLWSLRDFTILCIAALLSAVSLATIGFVVPAAAALSFGFLTIRRDDRTVLDFLGSAVRYFITSQQEYYWRL